MSAHPARRPNVLAAAGFVLVCMAAGGLYPLLFEAVTERFDLSHAVMNGVTIGLLGGVLLAAGEFAWFRARAKRLPFLPFLLLQTAYQAAVINAAVIGVSVVHQMAVHGAGLAAAMDEQSVRSLFFGPAFVKVNLYSFAAILLINFVRLVNRMLGRGSLVNLVTGKYHRPVEEERAFMFLDLNHSTAIAERLGHARYHEFLNDFFFDITPAVVESGGEIYQYVGDEVVLTWAPGRGGVPADCVLCYFRISAAVARSAGRYEKRYGVVPEFKAGVHFGPVVTGLIGDVKRAVVFHGDTVNTAARIRTECTTARRNLLFSGELLRSISLPGSLTPERMGRIRLRGKEKEIELFTLAEAG